METMQTSFDPQCFRVIHPLSDAPEEKCSTEGLGRIAMTPAVRLSLKVLRGYLMVMSVLLVYHVLDLAGVVHSMR